MANRNSGDWQRFENGGILLIGSDEIKNLVAGSLRILTRQRERIQSRDRGVLGTLTVGDERPQEIAFELWRTQNIRALIDLMLPAATTGVETYFTLTVKVPDYDGAATGKQAIFNKCYLPNGFDESAGGEGQDADKVAINITHNGPPPSWTSY